MRHQTISTRQNGKERTKRRIVAVAGAMLTEGAEEMLTMARVAERAEVTERTVYRHFPSREALIRASWASLESGMIESVRATLPDLDDGAARRRAATVQLFRSAHGRSMLHDLGLDDAAAVEAASEAVAILLGLQPAE